MILRRHGGKNGRPLSAVSVRHAHRALSAALQAAVELELVSRNVCAVARPPAAEVDEVGILGPAEITAVLEALKGRELYAVVALAASDRMSKGRIVRPAVAGRRLRQGMHKGRPLNGAHPRRPRLKQPKTKNSKRTITLSASAVTMLQEHRRQVLELRMRLGMGKLAHDDFVFSDHEGRPIPPNNLSVMWRRATRPLGLDVKFHSLRHSATPRP